MKRSVKVALATSALAVAGGLFLVGATYADGFGRGMRMGPPGHMGMMGGMGPEILKAIDTDKDGALSQEEIDAAISSRFAEFDADNNGSLSLQEFQALWAEITKPLSVRAFQFLDPDGDAAVSKAELDDRFGDVVKRFDRNEDGKLSPGDHMRRGDGGHRWGWRHRGGGPQQGGPDSSGDDE